MRCTTNYALPDDRRGPDRHYRHGDSTPASSAAAPFVTGVINGRVNVRGQYPDTIPAQLRLLRSSANSKA